MVQLIIMWGGYELLPFSAVKFRVSAEWGTFVHCLPAAYKLRKWRWVSFHFFLFFLFLKYACLIISIRDGLLHMCLGQNCQILSDFA